MPFRELRAQGNERRKDRERKVTNLPPFFFVSVEDSEGYSKTPERCLHLEALEKF